jgi:hypothetical protein
LARETRENTCRFFGITNNPQHPVRPQGPFPGYV